MIDLEAAYDFGDALRLGRQMDKGLFVWFEAPVDDALLGQYRELRGAEVVAPDGYGLGMKVDWDSLGTADFHAFENIRFAERNRSRARGRPYSGSAASGLSSYQSTETRKMMASDKAAQ